MGNLRPLSIDEVCEYLNIDRDTFYKGIEIKESLDCHFDRFHKFKKEDIDDQLMKGEGVDCGKEKY